MAARIAWTLPDSLRRVLDETPELRSALLVGGCVRDALLGVEPGEYDFEVPGLELSALATALARWGATDEVGRAFGVVKLRLPDGVRADFGVPRRDSKTGAGHRGFEVTFDPSITRAEASARRDFTVNALASDPRTGEVFDDHGGLADLEARVLRHTSPAFDEDPLRVLRAMKFAARFDFTVAPETVERCRSLVGTFAELPLERVREEWWSWASRALRPSRGLVFLRDCGWLAHFPELAALAGVPQDLEWHPEGDVWTHTLHVVDALADLPGWRGADETVRGVTMLAALAHDLGKPATTRFERRAGIERITSARHDEAGAALAESLFARMGMTDAIARRAVPLVREHMAHLSAPSARAVRRLSNRLQPATIAELALLIRADAAGRPPLPPEPPATLASLLAIADELLLADAAPKPLVLGRHLLAAGWEPGPEMGRALDKAFEAQLDGEFADVESGLAWIAVNLPKR